MSSDGPWCTSKRTSGTPSRIHLSPPAAYRPTREMLNLKSALPLCAVPSAPFRRQPVPIGMRFSVFAASGRLGSVTVRTPFSKAAFTLSGSTASSTRKDLWKLP